MDYSRSRLLNPNPLTVTLIQQNGSQQTVEHVFKRDEDLEAAADYDVIAEQQTTVSHLGAADLAGTVPRKGMRIQLSDDSVYRITSVGTHNHGARFRCPAQKERAG